MYRAEIVPRDAPAPLQDAAVARRRRLDADRRDRVLDPKWRTIGVDVAALDEQVRAKAAARREAQERDAEFDAYARSAHAALEHLDRQTSAARRHRDQVTDHFRLTVQRR
ncbi:hypothetical protein HK405_014650, partial [Cladochytrium tenue]